MGWAAPASYTGGYAIQLPVSPGFRSPHVENIGPTYGRGASVERERVGLRILRRHSVQAVPTPLHLASGLPARSDPPARPQLSQGRSASVGSAKTAA